MNLNWSVFLGWILKACDENIEWPLARLKIGGDMSVTPG
jgi:hypothetical protein